MELVILGYVPCIIALLTIGLLILLKNSRSMVSISFSLLTFNLGLWLLLLFIADLTISYDISLWAVKSASAVGSLLGLTMLFFCLNFPAKIGKTRGVTYAIALFPALFFAILSFTHMLIPAVEFVGNSAQPSGVGILYSLQSLYLLLAWGVGLALVIRKYRKVQAREKSQIKIVFIGLLMTLLVNVGTGYILTATGASNDYSNLIGSMSIMFFVIATAYAIVKYRLFDIRMAIVRLIGYIVTVTIVAAIYAIATIVVLGRLLGVDTMNSRPLAGMLIATTLFVSLTFQPLRKLIDKITLRIFYRHAYDEREVLDKLSDALVKRSSIADIATGSLHIIKNAILPSSIYFAVMKDDGTPYHEITSNQSYSIDAAAVLNHLKHQPQAIIDYDLAPSTLRDHTAALNTTLIVRLGKKSQPLGFIIFGHKSTGGVYTNQDIKLLQIAAKNLAIALENAKKYDQISHFNDTLKAEVRHATTRLRHANDQLKSLDKLKDDFISMASHQFRTPAASVHQALQMINNPALSPRDRKEMLTLAEINSAELVSLVGTMLSISRLQAGRFTIDKTPLDPAELVEKIIQTTTIVADQKHTKLKFKSPTKPITVEADAPKMREAMTNYIENAIKYSPENSTVHISLHEDNGRMYFEVTDEGMGVPEAERSKLFGKFYRAQNARKQQPDGNGIGLYVVRNIAEGHGGEAYYQPLEHGSLFGIWLPLHTDKSARTNYVIHS